MALQKAEVSILLTSDEEIQTLNQRWRDKDKPTDVLSFPLQPPKVQPCDEDEDDEDDHDEASQGQVIELDPALASLPTWPSPSLHAADLEAQSEATSFAISLGDIVVSVPTAIRQAQTLGHPLDAEIQRLLVHGMLHLIGHDHLLPNETIRMRDEEHRLLSMLASCDGGDAVAAMLDVLTQS